ncbi:carbonic anhydrase [Frateuria defendens]|uniref:carbonic anhydrase n=1 Tax=Frateuria defendens TaxID=2219559 RepID=UPI00066FC2AC|nr:carbonic anhydrase [Frateuria defendens]
MERLIEGFDQFRREVFPQQRELFKKLAHGQNPHTMFITCADSRVMPEMIFSTQPGELFVSRNVGNIVPPYGQFVGGVIAAIEYAVQALEVQNIVICGHSDCGAMKAVLHPEHVADKPAVATWLHHAETARHVVAQHDPELCGHDVLKCLTEENVVAQLDHLRTQPAVAARLARGTLRIHGWVYDIEHGEIRAFDAKLGKFVPLLPNVCPMPEATPRPRLAQAVAEALA